ncbi:6150_t:CDS:2 [Acaulospora colombiana]|uniref:6150_t:CDS:1 n=1 Tax=Acaulospora colombiana TaxID=27376 RepID=A0ACA9L0S2_9GLOM|nr:6150_t:CDS:2 [Acaulospora colombiana]
MDLRPYELFELTLSNAIEVLLARIEMDPCILENEDGSLRQLFIVIECPLLATSNRNESFSVALVKRVVRILGYIDDFRGKARDQLIDWFSKYDVEGFENIIRILHRYLDDHYHPPPALVTHEVIATVKALAMLLRREHLVKDALDQLIVKQLDLKKPLRVKFISGEEEAQDQGGIQREFFQVLLEKLLDPDTGMFLYDEQTRLHWINGASLENERKFELVGITLGVALFNGILVDINLPRALYKKLLGYSVTLEDIKEGFPDGDVYDIFVRNFEISYNVYGEERIFPLMQGGSDVHVTNENRKEYVEKYIDHFANKHIEKQFNALQRGFLRMCDGIVPKLCRAEELELLICGNRVLDFKELEKTVRYEGGFERNHPTIKNFWSVVHDFSHQHKKQILAFVTASDRVPIRGYSDMSFTIQRNGPDSDRLPTARTCFGVLLLPDYSTKAKLRDRLLVAIQNGRGFGFA